MRALAALRPRRLGPSLALLAELLGRGGAGFALRTAGGVDLRLTLQLDGTAVLRCSDMGAAEAAPLAEEASAAFAALTGRIEAAGAAVAGLRAGLDAVMAVLALVGPALAAGLGPGGWADLLRAAAAAALCAGLVPLRGRLLRALLRALIGLALRRASTG